MKPAFLAGALWLGGLQAFSQDLPLSPAAPLSLRAEVRLLQGDEFTGEFHGFASGMMRLRPIWSAEILRIPARNVAQIELRRHSPICQDPFPHQISLTNGDGLVGQMRDGEGPFLRFETLWGQTVTLRRALIAAMERMPSPDEVWVDTPFPVPDRFGDSVNTQQGWTADRTRSMTQTPLSSQNRHGIDIPPLSDSFVLEFNYASGQKNNIMVSIQSRTQTPRSPTRPMYILQVAPGNLYFRVRNQNANVALGDFENEPLHLRLYHDRVKGTIQVEVNGIPREQITLPLADLKGELRFEINSIQGPSAVERVKLSHWDGLAAIELPTPALPADHVRVRLKNGDILDGLWEGIHEGHLLMSALNGKSHSIGLPDLREFHTAPRGQSLARRNGRDVVLWLQQQSRPLTMQLLAWDAQHITGRAEGIEEELVIPVDRVARVVLNPYAKGRRELSLPRPKWRSLVPVRALR